MRRKSRDHRKHGNIPLGKSELALESSLIIGLSRPRSPGVILCDALILGGIIIIIIDTVENTRKLVLIFTEDMAKSVGLLLTEYLLGILKAYRTYLIGANDSPLHKVKAAVVF